MEDNGQGIPVELQTRIFELNFTTKHEDNFGLGIGLHVCRQIIAQHQGRIGVRSELGVYTAAVAATDHASFNLPRQHLATTEY